MKKIITLIALVLMPFAISAQSSNLDVRQNEYPIIDALLDSNWSGAGHLMGKDATFTMDWKRVLSNKFIKLEFQNKWISEDDERIIFKATALYQIVNNNMLVGSWFDNRGMILPLSGTINENELTILWGNEDTEMGKTIYYYNKATKKITVADFVMTEGKYAAFGSATYVKND